MMVRVGKVCFDDWVSLKLPGGWSDTFIFRLSPTQGLPPADYAGMVRSITPSVKKLRQSASLWIQVSGKGKWYAQEMRYALRGLPAPVAITSSSTQPQIWDFSFFPWVDGEPFPQPPPAEPYLKGKDLRSSELGCLRVLTRADCAYTAEVASLGSMSLPAAQRALGNLEEYGCVQGFEVGKDTCWKIRRPGISIALRSWGLPPGYGFSKRKERGRSACKERDAARPKPQHSSAGRHRLTARLWPDWLRQAWPQAQIWAGWSEVFCGRARPDALCWGLLDGHETLFWLEVESGNISRKILRNKTLWRVNQALTYVRRTPVRLVFVLLGLPWACEEGMKACRDLPDDVAIVIEDWRSFGELPIPEWGKVEWR